jgi:Arc/MetJ family transcription regulator
MCEDGMATNLALDDSLLDEALKIGNLKTKKDTVTTALKEFIARRKQLKIKD